MFALCHSANKMMKTNKMGQSRSFFSFTLLLPLESSVIKTFTRLSNCVRQHTRIVGFEINLK